LLRESSATINMTYTLNKILNNKNRIKREAGLALFLFLFISIVGSAFARDIVLSEQEVTEIGNKVFMNECSLREDRLIQWNIGEDFLSCGIGHFIWYPKGYKGPFNESFPEFLNYLKAQDVDIPEWLYASSASSCPWVSRDDFINNHGDIRIKQLQDFLIATKQLQARFIVRRLNGALELMLESAPEKDRALIKSRFERIAATPYGVYALADYINFKGLGILSSEQYNGKGWGLLQVLIAMKDEDKRSDPLLEFAATANNILINRVENAPVERNEERWLPGWKNRVNSYLK